MKRNLLAGLLAAAVLAGGAVSLAGCGGADPAPESAAVSSSPAAAIATVDDFYASPAAAGRDVRKLEKGYSLEDAKEDGCFVLSGGKVYNDGQYDAFLESCHQKQDAFVRVAQPTTEGDVILYDLLYDSAADRVYLVCDTTRDTYGAQEITLSDYDGAMEYAYQGKAYWVLYRGEVNDKTFQTEDVFLVAPVN